MSDPAKVVANQANLSGTSQSSQDLIASGTATFTLDHNAPLEGMVLVTDAEDETRYMYGKISSYSREKGTISIDILRRNGNGAVNSWKIYVTDVYVADLYYGFYNANQ